MIVYRFEATEANEGINTTQYLDRSIKMGRKYFGIIIIATVFELREAGILCVCACVGVSVCAMVWLNSSFLSEQQTNKFFILRWTYRTESSRFF